MAWLPLRAAPCTPWRGRLSTDVTLAGFTASKDVSSAAVVDALEDVRPTTRLLSYRPGQFMDFVQRRTYETQGARRVAPRAPSAGHFALAECYLAPSVSAVVTSGALTLTSDSTFTSTVTSREADGDPDTENNSARSRLMSPTSFTSPLDPNPTTITRSKALGTEIR